MNQTSDYWKKRAEAERAWQIKVEKDQRFFNTIIEAGYKNTLDEINRQIKADLAFFGGKLINAKGMQEYENLARQAVTKAKELRKSGHHITRKDFSDDVNQRLKVYNATMRINRNEMLKSKIGARLVELGIDQEGQLTNKFWNDYTKEKERQAGILGITAKSNLWTSKEVQKAIYAQIEGADFSKRVWANIDQLKANLDGLVSIATIRGDNPREMARWLVDNVSEAFENKKYATERLARTEMARVQFEAEKRSIIDSDYKYVQWFAETQACKVCREIADQDTEWGRGIYKVKEVPDIPVHPNCMCSISAYWVDEDKNKSITTNNVNASDSSVDYNLNDFYDISSFKRLVPNSEDEKRYNTMAQSWYNKLNNDEQESVAMYVRDSSNLNNWLANDKDLSKVPGWEHADTDNVKEQNKICAKENDELHSALSKFKRNEDIIVKRAMGQEEYINLLKEAKAESIQTFKRFKSTTPFDGAYGNEETIEYYVPKTVQGAYLDGKGYAEEKEFLISAGQKYRARYIEGEGLKVYVYPNT